MTGLCRDNLPNHTNVYLFKFNNGTTQKRPDICSNLPKTDTRNTSLRLFSCLLY